MHALLRKIIKTRSHFPSDDATPKLIWMALENIMTGRNRTIRKWAEKMNQFAIAQGDRFARRSAHNAQGCPLQGALIKRNA